MNQMSCVPTRARRWRAASRALVPASLILTLAAAAIAAESAAPPAKPAPGTGRISGRVLDRAGQPMQFTPIRIPALRAGTATDMQGRFVLAPIPAGTWTLSVGDRIVGELTRDVTVTAGGSTLADFRFSSDKIIELPVIDVVDKRKVDPTRTSTETKITAEKLRDLKADNLADAVSKVMGVVSSADGLHMRGGRANEVKTSVNGIVSNDALTDRSPGVAVLSVSSINVTTGGMDADLGDALSGLIQVETREGGDRFGGEIRWDTDRFGDPTKTFDRYDRFTVGVGGPTPIHSLSYFATYEGAFQDGYLRSSLTKPSVTLLDFLRFGNRQNNRVNGSLKLAWKRGDQDKLTLDVLRSRTIETPYDHMWSRQGFVKMTMDTIPGVDGAPDSFEPRYGSWSPSALDSSYVPMNLPDHVPTEENRFGQYAFVWSRQFSKTTALTARLSEFGYESRASVGLKEPWEYDTQSPFYWNGNTDDGTENNPFFATHGDFPTYLRSVSRTWVAKSDIVSTRWSSHEIKAGFEGKYNHLENLSLIGPNNETNGLPGASRSEYRYDNPEGSLFVRDRWRFEGMVMNAGLRWDLFSPGSQIPVTELPSGRRYKTQFSPRLGISFPVSDRDALSFYYGWLYQTPSRSQIFENRGPLAAVAVRGNPDLEPQTTISYQAGLQHVFSSDVSGQFAVFFKDIFGLISTQARTDEAGNILPTFVNQDYASSRGFEASIVKSFSHHFSSEFNYTYSFSNGVASDPRSALQFINGGRLYLPISERPLVWDQRHTLNASAILRYPGRWGLHLDWEYGSGQPFTPAFRNDRRSDPVLTNSRWKPSRTVLNVDGDKYYQVWGRPMTLFFDARNVLDSKNILALSPGSVNNPNVNLSGDDYLIYYTETGRAGGAYQQDRNGDGVLDWVALNDPRVYEEGRRVRLGVSTTF